MDNGYVIHFSYFLDKHYFGIVREKIPLCICTGSREEIITLIIESKSKNITGFDSKNEHFDLPSVVNLTSRKDTSNSGVIRSCIYLIFSETGTHEILVNAKSGHENLVDSLQINGIFPSNDNWEDVTTKEMSIELPIHFTSFISSQIGSSFFQWDFGDGDMELDESKKGLSSFSRSVKMNGCFNVSLNVLYISKSHRVRGISKKFTIATIRNIDPDRLESRYLTWKFLVAGQEEGYCHISLRKRTPEISILLNGTSSKSIDSYQFVPKIRVKRSIGFSVVVDHNTLIVVNHAFRITMSYDRFLHRDVAFIFWPPTDGSATFPYQSHTGEADVLVHMWKSSFFRIDAYRNTDLLESKLFHFTSSQEFQNFRVQYVSDKNFEIGEQITVEIESAGMEEYGIIYKLVCDDVTLFENLPRKSGYTYANISFSIAGRHLCSVYPSMPSRPGQLKTYVAATAKDIDQQYVETFNRITNLSHVIKVDGRSLSHYALSTKTLPYLEVVANGYGATFEVLFQGKNFSKPGNYFFENSTSSATFELPLEAQGTFDIQLKAWNRLSSINETLTVLVESPIIGFYVQVTGNSSIFCVPYDIEIQIVAIEGYNVVCEIEWADNMLPKAQVNASLHQERISCAARYSLLIPAQYNFTALMYNAVSREVTTSIVTGKQPTMYDLNLVAIVSDVLIGSDSVLKINGNFECPLLNCSIDFGDGKRIDAEFVINGSTFPHRYKTPGAYRISGKISSLVLPYLSDTFHTLCVRNKCFTMQKHFSYSMFQFQ